MKSENIQKIFFTFILLLILVSQAMDIVQDFAEGATRSHLYLETLLCVFVIIGLIVLWSKNIFLKEQLYETEIALKKSETESNKWKAENLQLIQGLSSSIDKQLEDWKLSPSEKEVTLLLLKGLSLKEIAEIRKVSERTVRQQSVNVYEKSNLSGRAELSAYFLEDLLK
jgi:DNA-binding CsgD family transcriptional regulator